MSTEKIVTATGLYQAVGKECNVKKSSMSLNKLRKNLNKTTAVAAAIAIATCLLPAIAQAQRRPQASGFSNIESDVTATFFLDTSIEDIDNLESVGEFPGAIQDFMDSGNPNTDLSFLFFPFGNLRTSGLTTDPTTGNFPGLSFGYEAITDDSPTGAFNNDGLRYDVTFPDRTETLTLFIPSNDSSLINSLSGFVDFLDSTGANPIQGVVIRPDIGIEERFIVTNPRPERRGFTFFTDVPESTATASPLGLYFVTAVPESSATANSIGLRAFRTTVPEPTATVSLLGLGALGAVSLLKRNKPII